MQVLYLKKLILASLKHILNIYLYSWVNNWNMNEMMLLTSTMSQKKKISDIFSVGRKKR